MRAILETGSFDGQLKFVSDDPFFRENSGICQLLTDDFHIINQDQAFEACTEVANRYELTVGDGALERLTDLVDSSPVDTRSFKPPFYGFDFKRFQRRAINVMRGQSSVMLQMSCGTGKTYTSLFMACERLDAGWGSKIVVWCPVSLITDWVKSFEAATDLSVGTPPIHATPAKRKEWYETDDSQVWVLNYERVRTGDKEHICESLSGSSPIFIYDEVTKLKNRKSALHKEMVKLRKAVGASAQIALTATPIVKGPEDFYNEFRLLEPSVFGGVKDFERLFTYGNGQKDIFHNYIGYQNLGYMHLMAGTHVFSATKTRPEIACEFPKMQEILVPYSLTSPMQSLYDEIFDYGASLADREGALFLLTFQRLCNMPQVLLLPHEYADSPYGEQLRHIDAICGRYTKHIMEPKNNAKLQLVEDKIGEILSEGEKAIVFAQHTHNCLFPLAMHLSKHKPLVYCGETPIEEKERVKTAFKGNGGNLLLMSDAGQVGLNFQECRYLLHYQTPISHAAYEQRSNRISRIDSEFDSISVIRFVCDGTVEERIEDTMQGRREMAGEMGLGGEEYEEVGTITESDADFLCGF